jgi:phage portal protein BeeE
MVPLMPDRTFPVRRNGELTYQAYINGTEVRFEPYEIFHLAGFSWNGLSGVPLVRLMSETLGLTKAEEQYCAAFFGNGCNFGGFIINKNPTGKWSKEATDSLQKTVTENYAGSGN